MPQPKVPPSFDALIPAIKRDWAARLRREVPASAIGNPDVLVLMMDGTLEQLRRGLRRADMRWLRQAPPLVSTRSGHCQCSFNPLLNYYATGEQALRAVAAPRVGRQLPEVLLVFHALAQQEIQTLCSLCQHRGEPGCRLRTLQAAP